MHGCLNQGALSSCPQMSCVGKEVAAPSSRTLDPDEAVEEVELAPGVGSGAPVRPADLVGLLREAGVLPDLVQDVGGEGAVSVGLKDDTLGETATWGTTVIPHWPAYVSLAAVSECADLSCGVCRRRVTCAVRTCSGLSLCLRCVRVTSVRCLFVSLSVFPAYHISLIVLLFL